MSSWDKGSGLWHDLSWWWPLAIMASAGFTVRLRVWSSLEASGHVTWM